MEHDRKSFLFYGSYLDAVEKLKSDKDKLELFFAVAKYGLDQKQPKFNSELAAMAWVFIEPLLDANYQNYLNGGKGGAPKGNQNAKKTTQNNRKTTQNNHKQGNDNVNDNDKDNVKDKVKDNDKDNVNVNDNDNENVNDINTLPPDDEDDDWFIPYQDENGKWITAGEEDLDV